MDNIKTFKGFPVFGVDMKSLENDEAGVYAVSLVGSPAIELDMLKFSKEEFKFSLNNDKQIVTSPIMLANTPILRHSKGIGYYYIVFTADILEKLSIKYFKEGKNHSFNLNHSNEIVPEAVAFESWLITSSDDKAYSMGYTEEQIPVGSWMMSIYFPDTNYWNTVVKSDEFKGLSLEGDFGIEPMFMSKDIDTELLVMLYQSFKNNESDELIIAKLKELVTSIEQVKK